MSHSPCSLSLPLTPLLLPLTPLTPSCSLLPLAPTEVVGAPKHSITYPYPTLAIGRKSEWEEAREEWEGVRGSKGSEREWGEQEGARWEGPLAQQSWWASQNLPPQVVGTPKHTPRSPLCPTSAQSIVSEERKLGARGGTLGSREVVGTPKIGPTGGRDPKTYPSISITPYLTLAPPCPLSLPGNLRTSWDLRKPWNLQKPSAALAVFGPKCFGLWWGPTKAFCGYVNGHWVGTVLPGGGDT